MKRIAFLAALLLVTISLSAQTRENIWPKNKMPDFQEHQIAAKRTDAKKDDFKPEKNRQPYLEWHEAPTESNGGCMILLSGGSYTTWYDVALVESWAKRFTELGFQCVSLVYRTPRPEGLPIYQSAWEDGQRAVRLVRSQAIKRGYDPEKIGVIAMSAGAHMGLLLATSSQTQAYEPIDNIDNESCHINWAILNAPAYGTTDANDGTKAKRQGYGADVKLDEIFKFDSLTCPISFHHGSKDPYAPQTSTLAYRRLRQMGVPAELHIYPDLGHGAHGLERGVEFMRQMGYLGELLPEEKLLDRFTSDDSREYYERQNIYPEEVETVINSQPYVVDSLVVEDNGGLTALIYPNFPQGAKDGMNQDAFIKYIEGTLSDLNKELPNYAKLKKIEVMSEDFERTPKKSIKRYLYQR